MMKNILVVFAIVMTTSVFSQEGVDPRLIANHGDKIISLYESNREAYNQILYRLENSFYITKKSKFKGDESTYLPISGVTAKDGSAFTANLLNDLKSFNYVLYNFRVSQTGKTVYDLGDGRLMIFYSLNEMQENYSRGANNSNDEKNN